MKIRDDNKMSVSTKLDDIEHFALNLSDLTGLNSVELLLVRDKIIGIKNLSRQSKSPI